MVSESLLFVFSLVDTGLLLFLLVYFVITLSDLECDYLNAQECCSKLNIWILPKIFAHGFLVFLLLWNGHWVLLLVNFPVVLWLLHEYYIVPKGNMGVYDPTEIHNSGQLKKHMRECIIQIGFYLVLFFVYFYCLIISLLKEDPLPNDDQEHMEF